MIEVKNLKKSYGSFRALHGISFTVESGHVYGFLGPNGAGKSTTMNIITGCLAASDGSVTINGHDIFSEPIEAKKCIGYLPEQPPLYPDMKVTEYLTFVGRAKGLRGAELYGQIDEVIDLSGLSQVYDRLIKNLSKGYKQRVGIAQAMLGNPEVIILDEPTVGLDPIQIIEIRDLIKSLAKNHTVILSSHIMQEISAVCDRIMIISGGRLVANDTVEGLLSKYSQEIKLELVCRTTKERLSELLSGVRGVTEHEYADTDTSGVCTALLTYEASCDIRDEVWRRLAAASVTVLCMTPHVMTLEDIFLSLTSAYTAQDPDDEDVEDDDEDERTDTADADGSDDDSDDSDDSDDDDSGDDSDDDSDDGGYKPLFS